jgi:hypothetical protein
MRAGTGRPAEGREHDEGRCGGPRRPSSAGRYLNESGACSTTAFTRRRAFAFRMWKPS